MINGGNKARNVNQMAYDALSIKKTLRRVEVGTDEEVAMKFTAKKAEFKASIVCRFPVFTT